VIDVAIAADRNGMQKEAEKKLKYRYKCLCIETKRMWHMKYTIIPVITVAKGMVRKVL
jgi:hypothetical protein